MNLRPSQTALLAAALALLAVSLAAPQSSNGQAASRDSVIKTSSHPALTEKEKLADATRVSTTEAARRAAQELAKKNAPQGAGNKEGAKKGAASAVSEFKPVSKAQGDSTDAVQISPKDSGKSPLKNIHGSVQGSGGSGIRQGGAEVGATSKSGKTAIYVETEGSHSDPATPH